MTLVPRIVDRPAVDPNVREGAIESETEAQIAELVRRLLLARPGVTLRRLLALLAPAIPQVSSTESVIDTLVRVGEVARQGQKLYPTPLRVIRISGFGWRVVGTVLTSTLQQRFGSSQVRLGLVRTLDEHVGDDAIDAFLREFSGVSLELTQATGLDQVPDAARFLEEIEGRGAWALGEELLDPSLLPHLKLLAITKTTRKARWRTQPLVAGRVVRWSVGQRFDMGYTVSWRGACRGLRLSRDEARRLVHAWLVSQGTAPVVECVREEGDSRLLRFARPLPRAEWRLLELLGRAVPSSDPAQGAWAFELSAAARQIARPILFRTLGIQLDSCVSPGS